MLEPIETPAVEPAPVEEPQDSPKLDASTIYPADEPVPPGESEPPAEPSNLTPEEKKVEEAVAETPGSYLILKDKDGKDRRVTAKEWTEAQSTIGRLNTDLDKTKRGHQTNQEGIKVVLDAFKHLVGDEKFAELDGLTKLDKAVIAKLPAELQVPLLQLIDKQQTVQSDRQKQYDEALKYFGRTVDEEWAEMTGTKKDLYPGAEEVEPQMIPLIQMGLTPKQAYGAIFGTTGTETALKEQEARLKNEFDVKIATAVESALAQQATNIKERRETIHLTPPANGRPPNKPNTDGKEEESPKTALARGFAKIFAHD